MATLNELQEYAKRVYDKKIAKIVPSPDRYPLISKMPMKNVLGGSISSTIIDKLPGGFTISAGGKVTLNGDVPARTYPIEGDAYDMYLRSELTLDAIYKASDKGPKAYGNLIVEYGAWNKMSMMNRLELNASVGGHCIGSFPDDAATRVDYTSGTSANILITTGSFIPDAYQMGDVLVDVYTVLNATGAYTKLNTNAPVVVTGSSIGSTNTTLTVTGNATDLASINSTNDAGDDRTFEIWFHGARTNAALVETEGLARLVRLAPGDVYKGYTLTTGSLFLPTFEPNLNAALSFAGIETALMPALQRGARATSSNPWHVYTSYYAWKSLVAELRSTGGGYFRQIIEGGSKTTVGTTNFMFDSAAGPVKVIPTYSVPVSEAYAVIHSPEHLKRVGSAEARPAYEKMGGQVWTPQETTNAVQTLMYSRVGIHCTKLANLVGIAGITVDV